MFGNDVNFNNFDNSKDILHYSKDIAPIRRKTILSALVVITDKNEYRDLKMQEYNKDISKQEKTLEQVSNWVNGNEIYDELKRNADLLYKKKTLTPSDL